VAHLAERPGLDLPDALARHPEAPSDFVHGARVTVDEPDRNWMMRRSRGVRVSRMSSTSASSGKTSGRHRLNHGGDRHANCAPWRVVIVRLATDAPTKHYMARRIQEGMSKPEIIRCLKRYVAREIYRELTPRAALAAVA
jgi:hypothetical protein